MSRATLQVHVKSLSELPSRSPVVVSLESSLNLKFNHLSRSFLLKRILNRVRIWMSCVVSLSLLRFVLRALHRSSAVVLLKPAMHVPRWQLGDWRQRGVRLIEAHRRHRGGWWRTAAVTTRVGCALARTIVVVIGIVFSSCSILRRLHHVVGLGEVLTCPRRLRSVSESEARRVNDSVVADERHGHLGGLANLRRRNRKMENVRKIFMHALVPTLSGH